MKHIFQLIAIALSLAITSSSQATQYVYDQLNRLTQVRYDSGKTLNYSYDAAGNLLRITTIDVPKYLLEGHVTGSDGNPLAGVLIKVDDRSATTDENGYYQITDLPVGNYTLIAELNQHNFTPQNFTINENQSVVIDIISDGLTECLLYAVHDEGRRDTQFFTINPAQGFEVKLLGTLHLKQDIEALDIHPETNQIFAAAGDDGTHPGHLYQVNARTGGLIRLGGNPEFNEINGLSFKSDGTLWGWAEGKGLIQIDTQTGNGSSALSYDGPVEDITWDNQGVILYGVENNQLLAYNSQTGNLSKSGCTLPGGEVEALEMLPDGRLLFGIHDDQSVSIHALDINSCDLIGINISTQVEGIVLNDVEGIAWPIDACLQ